MRLLLPFAVLLLARCSSVGTLTDSDLSSGKYFRVKKDGGRSDRALVHIEVQGDSIAVVTVDERGLATGPRQPVSNGQVFMKPSLDIDVLVVVFKYRPEVPSLPSQLTADFNGNLFVGYRRDWYTVRETPSPFGARRKIRQKAISVGGFAGIGTTMVSPWTTNYQTTDEYNGFILTKGLSAMLGVKALTVGVGVGWDNLVDRDEDIWVYQFKPWYGLTLSLNLN